MKKNIKHIHEITLPSMYKPLEKMTLKEVRDIIKFGEEEIAEWKAFIKTLKRKLKRREKKV